jgi:histidine triad (HIT) family protein
VVADAGAARRVYEDAGSVAFLDHRPLFPGHVLLVPREHRRSLEELSPQRFADLLGRVQLLARAVRHAMECQGIFLAVNDRVSQSVPHLHVHVVPRNQGDGLRGFFWPRHRYRDDAHAADTQARIQRALRSLERAELATGDPAH